MSANLEGQLLYDLTLKSSFSIKGFENGPYSLAIDGWPEKLSYFVKTRLPWIVGPYRAVNKVLPLICHTWRLIIDGPRMILIITKSEGAVFSEENGFTEAIWRFDLAFDHDTLFENHFRVVPIEESSGVVLLADNNTYQACLIDVNSKKCTELMLNFANNGTIVGCWNVPHGLVNERAVFILFSFGDWKIFSINTLRAVISGKIDGCPALSSAVFLSKYWLIIAGHGSGASLNSLKKGDSGVSVCFSAFRLLSSLPYVKTDDGDYATANRYGIGSRLLSFRRNRPDVPVHIAVSPSETSLCVLHDSGLLSIWAAPSLKLRSFFKPDLQRNFSEEVQSAPAKHGISQICWWSDDCLSLLFVDGAFTVCRADDMHSVIGDEAEWFEQSSVMTVSPQDAAFIVQKQPRCSQSQHEEPPVVDSTAVLPTSGGGYFAYLKHIFGYFYPKATEGSFTNEGSAVAEQLLELWSFQKVTPEELFEIKLENEEYGDALILARAYNFDTDLIHLRRWKKEVVSRASIEDFLAKVSNRRTAINECISRVAETLDGQRELLEFGNKLTDPCEEFGVLPESGMEFLKGFLDDADQNVVDTMASLKIHQAEILLWHFRIMEFAKRLQLYESLLLKHSDLVYDPDVYAHIRDTDVFELVIEAARGADVDFVDLIFSYYTSMLEPFRLLVLSNFPETLSPNSYMQLLPGTPVKVVTTDFDGVLQSDFVRQMLYGQIKYKPEMIDSALLVEMPQLTPFLPVMEADGSFARDVPSVVLSKWFIFRAEEIENVSWNIENAVHLLGFGKDSGVSGLEDVYVDFKILGLLVYSCGLKTFSLNALRSSQPMDIMKFLLANSRKAQTSSQLLEKHIKIWFQPYADLLEQKFGSRTAFESVFIKFLTDTAPHDLEFVVLVLRLCCRKESGLLTENVYLLTAAIESIYACKDPESTPLFDQVLSQLPTRKSSDDLEVLKRHNEIDKIRLLIEDCKIMSKYGLLLTIAELRDIITSGDQCCDLLNQMMIRILRSSKDRSSNFFWTCVLADGLKLVDNFGCTDVTKDDFLTIYARHLLMFGDSSVGRLGKLMESNTFVNIAKTVLTFSHAQSSERQGSPCLSYTKSARLAVSVAKELFESSADLEDSALGRAQMCLDLIPKQYVAIDDELGVSFGEIQRLLGCCDLLRQLEAPIVPLSLKVTGDRLGLLANVISSSPDTCLRNSTVFLRLAELLEVADTKSESRNLGLKLLANCAIGSGNLDAGLSYCEQIVSAGFALAWQECAQLCELRISMSSEAEVIVEPERLFPLITFALAHCDSPNRMRSLIIVRQRIVADHCSIALKPPADVAGKVVSKVVTTVAKEVGGRATSGFKHATSMLFTDRFRPIVSLISQSLPEQRRKIQDTQGNANATLLAPRLDTFTDHDLGVVKRFIRDSETASDIALMLRLACISSSEKHSGIDLVSETELQGQIVNIGKELVSNYIDSDLAFVFADCISLALSRADANLMADLLDVISPTWPPKDAKVAVLSAYLIGLFVEKFEDRCAFGPDNLLNKSPIEVISKLYSSIMENTDALKSIDPLSSRFKDAIDALFEMDESQSISKQLPPGVDSDRFFADESYRSHTILLMAIDNFEQAISLADRFKLPTENLRLKFVQHAIIQSADASHTAVIADSVTSALLPLLAENDSFKKTVVSFFFQKEILSKIPGNDHKKIALFFDVVEALAPYVDMAHDLPQNGKSIASLLCTHEQCFQGVDFHEIAAKPNDERLWQLLDGVADDSSLTSIVQLVELLPQVSLTASSIYRHWSLKKFQLALSLLHPIDANTISSAASSVDSYFVHLTPKDFSEFLFEVYASDSLVNQTVPLSAKQALLKRFLQSLKSAKLKQAKEKSPSSPTDWSAAQDAFRVLARHLDRLNSSTWIQLELVVESAIYSELRSDFDRTLSREPALTKFIAEWLSRLPVAGNGLGPEVVELMLNCVDYRTKAVPEVYSACFRHQLSVNSDPSPLVLAVSKWNKIGKTILVSDIFSSFRETVFSFIVRGEGEIGTLTPKQRLQLLHRILDASSGLLNLSRSMLMDADFLYLQLNACLQEHNFEVRRDDLASESSRADLLVRIREELPWQASVELIKILPPFEDPVVRTSVMLPMLKQAATAAANSTNKTSEVSSFACLVRELFTDKRINATELMDVADVVATLGYNAFAIIICLISSVARDSPVIIEYLAHYDPSTLNIRQPLLCSELLEAGLLHKFAQTAYFVPLVEYAVGNQSSMSFSIPQLIDQLGSFGLEEEVEYVRKKALARGQLVGHVSDDQSSSSASLLSSVSGAFRRWF